VGRFHVGRVSRAAGFPTRGELIARYEERSARAVADLHGYTALALWKSVVFMEGNYRRAIEGRTDDPYLRSFGEGVLELAARAEAVAFGA
jgi:aminoglycoside phosphotransferase (APT) family kinase protein